MRSTHAHVFIVVTVDSIMGAINALRAYGSCFRAQELCESRGGRPGLPVPNSPSGLCGREVTLNMSLSPELEQGLRLW